MPGEVLHIVHRDHVHEIDVSRSRRGWGNATGGGTSNGMARLLAWSRSVAPDSASKSGSRRRPGRIAAARAWRHSRIRSGTVGCGLTLRCNRPVAAGFASLDRRLSKVVRREQRGMQMRMIRNDLRFGRNTDLLPPCDSIGCRGFRCKKETPRATSARGGGSSSDLAESQRVFAMRRPEPGGTAVYVTSCPAVAASARSCESAIAGLPSSVLHIPLATS